MHWRILGLAALFLRVATAQVAAQAGDALHPCRLLTTAQLSAALGTVGATQEGDMPGSGRGANPLRSVGHHGRDFLSIRRQGTEHEDEYPGAAGLHEQHVRCAQGARVEVREERFRKHELLASDAAARRCEEPVCDDLRHGGQGDAGHDLGVIETERPHGEAQDLDGERRRATALALATGDPIQTAQEPDHLAHRLGHGPRRQTEHSAAYGSLWILFPPSRNPPKQQPLPRGRVSPNQSQRPGISHSNK